MAHEVGKKKVANVSGKGQIEFETLNETSFHFEERPGSHRHDGSPKAFDFVIRQF